MDQKNCMQNTIKQWQLNPGHKYPFLQYCLSYLIWFSRVNFNDIAVSVFSHYFPEDLIGHMLVLKLIVKL